MRNFKTIGYHSVLMGFQAYYVYQLSTLRWGVTGPSDIAPPFRTQHDFDKEAVGWHARSISRPILGLYLILFGIS